MIQTLKSELKLRPTYDELIGMISSQGDENRPSIETVIDRKATIFRNNQFGSQFDNVDFLGLKQQEEDKLKHEMRQHQLRQTAMNTESSMGALSASVVSSPPLSYGGQTPSDAYYRSADATPRMTLEQINTIQDEMRRHQQQQASSSLAEVAQQELPPSDIQPFSIATDDEGGDMPPLETPTEVAEEEEEEESGDDDETQVPPQTRKHKETIDYNENISRWKQSDISIDDILFQLHLRGIQLTKEQEEEMEKLKIKGKGKSPTKKDYLLNYVERLIQTGK